MYLYYGINNERLYKSIITREGTIKHAFFVVLYCMCSVSEILIFLFFFVYYIHL